MPNKHVKGFRVTELRKKRGISRLQMASILGVSRSHLSNIEYFNIKVRSLVIYKIVNFFNVPINYIVFKDEAEKLRFDFFNCFKKIKEPHLLKFYKDGFDFIKNLNDE